MSRFDFILKKKIGDITIILSPTYLVIYLSLGIKMETFVILYLWPFCFSAHFFLIQWFIQSAIFHMGGFFLSFSITYNKVVTSIIIWLSWKTSLIISLPWHNFLFYLQLHSFFSTIEYIVETSKDKCSLLNNLNGLTRCSYSLLNLSSKCHIHEFPLSDISTSNDVFKRPYVRVDAIVIDSSKKLLEFLH